MPRYLNVMAVDETHSSIGVVQIRRPEQQTYLKLVKLLQDHHCTNDVKGMGDIDYKSPLIGKPTQFRMLIDGISTTYELEETWVY